MQDGRAASVSLDNDALATTAERNPALVVARAPGSVYSDLAKRRALLRLVEAGLEERLRLVTNARPGTSLTGDQVAAKSPSRCGEGGAGQDICPERQEGPRLAAVGRSQGKQPGPLRALSP